MKRWLALGASVLLFWGAAMACSGGGGGGGTGTPPNNQTSSNDVTLPDGSIKHPDGSVTHIDGSITYPDGSIKMPDGTIKKPDGTVVQVGNGPVLKPGTIVVGGETFALPDNKITAPTASLATDSGVKAGSILEGGKPVTAKAQAQPGATYLWELTGPAFGEEKPMKGVNAEYTFTLPAATKVDAADQYVLVLKVTKDGKESTQSIPFQVYPPAVSKITLTNGNLIDGKNWPTASVMKLSAEGSLFASSYVWKIQDMDKTVSCPKVSPDGMTCEFTPSKPLKYAVALTAKGQGGESAQPATFAFQAGPAPSVTIIGIDDGAKIPETVTLKVLADGAKTLGPVTLKADVKLGGGQDASDVVVQSWTFTKDGVDLGIMKQPEVTIKDPAVYEAKLTATVGGVPTNEAIVNFTILAPLTVAIVDATNNPLPGAIAVKSAVTLQLKDAIPPEYGTVTYAWYIKPENGSAIKGIAPTIDVTFDQEALYSVILTIKNPQLSSVPLAQETIAVKSMALPHGVISGIDNGLSYLKRPFYLNGNGSSGQPDTFDWTLTYTGTTPNTVEGDPPADKLSMWLFFPDNFGSYLLDLVVQNALGAAAPSSAAFNIRVSEAQMVLPFTPPAVSSLYAVAQNDVYVGSATGLMHFGADGQWVVLSGLDGAVDAIWARSSNEVYATVLNANNQQQIIKYTAKDGWVLSSILATHLTTLTGNAYRLAGMDVLKGVRVYDFTNKQWAGPIGANVSQLALSPDNYMFTIYNDRLGRYDAQNNLQEFGVAEGKTWESLVAIRGDLAYLANSAGEVYQFNGTQMILMATLPLFSSPGGDVQQFAKALWVEGGSLRVVTQVGGVYVVRNGKVALLYVDSLGKIDVGSAFAKPGLVLANNAQGVPYHLDRDMLDGQLKWLPLLPGAEDFLMSNVVGFSTTSARQSGQSVYVINAYTPIDSHTIQEIMPDGHRRSVAVVDMVRDLCGVDGNAYFATDKGLFKYDGAGNNPVAVAAAGLPDVKAIKALACPGTPNELYVANSVAVYYSTDGGESFISKLKPAPIIGSVVQIVAMHVVSSGEIILVEREIKAGSPDSYHININGQLLTDVTLQGVALRVAGFDMEHLYALTKTNVLKYNVATSTWDGVTPAGVPAGTEFRDIQWTDTALYFEANKGYAKIALSDGASSFVGGSAIAYHAQGTPDFVYFGLMIPDNQGQQITGPMALSRDGPMQ